MASLKSLGHSTVVKLRRGFVEHMDSMVSKGWPRRGPCPLLPALPSISAISPIPSWLSLDYNTAWLASLTNLIAILVNYKGS